MGSDDEGGGGGARRAVSAVRRPLFSFGVVFGSLFLVFGSTPTLAAWTDTANVSGSTLTANTMAAPTGLTVSQTCVADPTPVQRGTATTGTGDASLTLTRPSAAVAGDLLLAVVAGNGNHSALTLTPPAGWTLARKDVGNQRGQYVYTRVVGASEPSSYTWTGFSWDSAGGVAAFSGVDTANPVDVTSGVQDADGGTVTAPSVTTTRANVLLVAVFGATTWSSTPIGTPTGMTSVWSFNNGNGLAGRAATESRPTPGATGTRTTTAPDSQSTGQLIALQPPRYPYATTTWTTSASTYESGQIFTRKVGAVTQQQTALADTVTTRTEGPLTSGIGYTVEVAATFHNWVSPTGATSFAGMAC